MADPNAPSPELAALLGSLGVNPSALTSAPAPTSQADLSAALIQSAQATSAPYGSPLPWWVQSLQNSLVAQGQFGKVYQAGEGLVYFGTGGTNQVPLPPANKYESDPGLGGPPRTASEPANKDYAVTVTQANNLPYTWDEGEVQSAMERMRNAGLSVNSFDDLVQAWQGLVNRAATTYAMTDGERKLTPWDVLDLYKKESDTTGSGGFTGTKSYVQKNVTDITEGQAFSTIQGALSSMLGRDPSDQETRDFLYRMNHMAAQNPSISKTVYQFKNGKRVGESTHTDPGFTAADMQQKAYDQAQNEPDYAEYRGASYLFNAVLSALGPMGG